MIKLSHVTYCYSGGRGDALRDVSLTIQPGECTLVTGNAGAGKTTLCLAAAGVLTHEFGGKLEGEISIGGRDVADFANMSAIGTHIGMVFDDPDSQLIFSTVEEEILSGIEHRGLPRDETEARLERVMDLCRIADLRDRAPHTLSGGQKQRVAIAATLALGTEALILDEPTSELDSQATRLVFDILQELKQQGVAILIVEHKTGEILDLVDHVFQLSGGMISAVADPYRLAEGRRLVRCSGEDQPGLSAAVTPPQGREIISVSGLDHRYGDIPALEGIDLTISSGECVAIIGENGSGKTTLVKHFNGLLAPTAGHVTVLGHDTTTETVTRLARHVGLVFQNPDTMLFADTVADEVAFGVKNLGIPDPEARISEALEQVHLSETRDLYPRSLSRGERQRLAVACILAMQPEVIILDEPTTGLDTSEACEVMEILKRHQRDGHTVIIVTHSMEIVEQYADRTILLREGKIISDTRAGERR